MPVDESLMWQLLSVWAGGGTNLFLEPSIAEGFFNWVSSVYFACLGWKRVSSLSQSFSSAHAHCWQLVLSGYAGASNCCPGVLCVVLGRQAGSPFSSHRYKGECGCQTHSQLLAGLTSEGPPVFGPTCLSVRNEHDR